MSNSFGFGGTNATLIMERYTGWVSSGFEKGGFGRLFCVW